MYDADVSGRSRPMATAPGGSDAISSSRMIARRPATSPTMASTRMMPSARSGSLAHSWVMAFDDELEAFRGRTGELTQFMLIYKFGLAEIGLTPNVPFMRASYMLGDPYAEPEDAAHRADLRESGDRLRAAVQPHHHQLLPRRLQRRRRIVLRRGRTGVVRAGRRLRVTRWSWRRPHSRTRRPSPRR